MMRPISQQEFETLLDDLAQKKKELGKGKKLSLADYLQTHGFLPVLESLHFTVPQKAVFQIPGKNADESMVTSTQVLRRTELFTELDFSGLVTIKNCSFDCCDLSGAKIENLNIENCSFNNTVLNKASIKNTQAQYCSFNGTSFDHSQLQQVVFKQCPVSHCSLNNLQVFDSVIWQNCPMDYVSIVGGATARDVIIRADDGLGVAELVTDKTIYFDKIHVKNSQPAILVSWNNSMPGVAGSLTETMLAARNLNPVRMDYCPTVNEVELDKEITELNQLASRRIDRLKADLLAKITAKNNHLLPLEISLLFAEGWKKEKISFPMVMIETMRELHANEPTKFPQMAALYAYAKSMFDQVDGVLIPGGQDIDPRFYGQPLHLKTKLPNYLNGELSDARRDALEFSLVYIQQRASKPKPLCGICRGSQVIAASYDGTLYQDVGDPKRAAYLVERLIPKAATTEETARLSTQSRLIARSNRENLAVIFLHHQGYNLDTAHGLTATASTRTSSGFDLDTVAENLDQNICITQSHPEFTFDKGKPGNSGLSSKVSALAADGIFGQFEMRVRAYTQSQSKYQQLSYDLSVTARQSGFFNPTRAQNHHDLPVPFLTLTGR
ncbi:gamma-glutamyl-gamma-aminobutyrate hydrolase family protein [Legionella sp. 31fI33]|uniref:gamma-glutamyl-gamma-aminobutyrate hydrolase family protein n=1 Tax=Legionella sp. 31fI33 TaxID=2886376 RepID=UPI001E2A77F4|nr:gamma-glutamyl-gamma-aminobutyrate hydrolase family protein [Legionella sp. 31fI33]MCC5016324.1 gamma-glutamyl-gamma-aminobutyrate hydrolase family protein [Legionella sp. 31fI33]